MRQPSPGTGCVTAAWRWSSASSTPWTSAQPTCPWTSGRCPTFNILQCCSVPLCRHHYRGSLLGVAVLGAVSCCNSDTIMVPSRHSPSATSTTSLRYRDTRLWTRTMRRRDTRREARSSTSGPSWSTRNSSPRMRGARASRRRRKRRSLQFKRRCSS